MLFALKDEAKSNLNSEENDFMLDTSYGEKLEELTAAVIGCRRKSKQMRHKMVQIDYEKLNALYDTFVPQQELFADQTYFSIPSTSENGSKSKYGPSESPERENIKLELQKLFNSIKATQAQHQNEIIKMFNDVTQKTYAYANVRAQNQDLLMRISKLKIKLQMNDKGKHVNTKFDKSKTLGKLLYVTSFNKNLAIKAKNVSNTKVTSDRSKPVTSQFTPTISQKQQHNANVIARGMYKIN
uniref:Integrase, catalytic region, zinc finger, CCHC-type, peptidase aspartic, catalytic n=1 Tax=Tanacetum cinerariifolium TaxID=118510 RepID=A0A699JJE0_TANCI|nr:hypothetical protein [Tanacetum cinerariifolium]